MYMMYMYICNFTERYGKVNMYAQYFFPKDPEIDFSFHCINKIQ